MRQWSGGWLLGEPLKNGEPLVGQWLRRGCAHILGFLIYGVQYWQVGILTELPAMFFAFIFCGYFRFAMIRGTCLSSTTALQH